MSEWNPSEKYTPKNRGEYLCFTPKQTVIGTQMNARTVVLQWTGNRWISSATVTHWMPLPEPPK